MPIPSPASSTTSSPVEPSHQANTSSHDHAVAPLSVPSALSAPPLTEAELRQPIASPTGSSAGKMQDLNDLDPCKVSQSSPPTPVQAQAVPMATSVLPPPLPSVGPSIDDFDPCPVNQAPAPAPVVQPSLPVVPAVP